MKYIPFLTSDASYPIHNYLQKNWKTCDPTDVDKIRYDFNMNLRRVVIENAFGYLKNRWRSLKHFNSIIDRTSPFIVACMYFTTIVKCEVHRSLDWQMQQ
jgi:hypothetical protein